MREGLSNYIRRNFLTGKIRATDSGANVIQKLGSRFREVMRIKDVFEFGRKSMRDVKWVR